MLWWIYESIISNWSNWHMFTFPQSLQIKHILHSPSLLINFINLMTIPIHSFWGWADIVSGSAELFQGNQYTYCCQVVAARWQTHVTMFVSRCLQGRCHQSYYSVCHSFNTSIYRNWILQLFNCFESDCYFCAWQNLNTHVCFADNCATQPFPAISLALSLA